MIMLTPRERQVHDLVARGFSNRQVAAELAMSEGTVKIYLHRIFNKLGASSRYELMAVGMADGEMTEDYAL